MEGTETMSDWEWRAFGKLLRTKRPERLPKVSQKELAEQIGSSQAQVSRWESEYPDQPPPSWRQCFTISEVLDVDFIELARMCGHMTDEIEAKLRSVPSEHMGVYVSSEFAPAA